ncbi:MAG: exodeoxyribonuclease [Thermoleophilaceae bacterium]|jgi:exonuclease III|nr:exodeoxyribonuclease [Thermoleophilaceae bacterium]
MLSPLPMTKLPRSLLGSARALLAPERPVETEALELSAMTLNIGAAAAPRAEAILEWVAARGDDVVVLTETSGGPGTRLLVAGLAECGYAVREMLPEGVRDRGVLVASRLPVHQVFRTRIDVTLPWRAVGMVLDTDPRVAVLGVYVPSRDRSPVKVARKEQFIDSFLASVGRLPGSLRGRLLVVGDYNVVRREHEPWLPGFFDYEYRLHEELERLGFAAAHDLDGHSVHPHSWIGRTGTGYLYDYVHVGSALHDHVDHCAYLHEPRTTRLSDHAAVEVRLRLR